MATYMYLMSLMQAIPVVPGSMGLPCPCNTTEGMNTHARVWYTLFKTRIFSSIRNALEFLI